MEIIHTEPTIQFDFFGSGLQGVNDESWGLDNVELFAARASLFDHFWAAVKRGLGNADVDPMFGAVGD